MKNNMSFHSFRGVYFLLVNLNVVILNEMLKLVRKESTMDFT